MDIFHVRFFPLTAQDNMDERFIEIRQEGMRVDAYATEF